MIAEAPTQQRLVFLLSPVFSLRTGRPISFGLSDLTSGYDVSLTLLKFVLNWFLGVRSGFPPSTQHFLRCFIEAGYGSRFIPSPIVKYFRLFICRSPSSLDCLQFGIRQSSSGYVGFHAETRAGQLPRFT